MAKASDKSFGMEVAISEMLGESRRITIACDICVSAPIGCGGPAVDFRDELSRKEYTISGLCQQCQDKIFGVGDEE